MLMEERRVIGVFGKVAVQLINWDLPPTVVESSDLIWRMHVVTGGGNFHVDSCHVWGI